MFLKLRSRIDGILESKRQRRSHNQQPVPVPYETLEKRQLLAAAIGYDPTTDDFKPAKGDYN